MSLIRIFLSYTVLFLSFRFGVFSCSDSISAIMQVVRENQVIVVVGETGSGKTTQLTQVYFIIYSLPGVTCTLFL